MMRKLFTIRTEDVKVTVKETVLDHETSDQWKMKCAADDVASFIRQDLHSQPFAFTFILFPFTRIICCHRLAFKASQIEPIRFECDKRLNLLKRQTVARLPAFPSSSLSSSSSLPVLLVPVLRRWAERRRLKPARPSNRLLQHAKCTRATRFHHFRPVTMTIWINDIQLAIDYAIERMRNKDNLWSFKEKMVSSDLKKECLRVLR